MAKHCSVCNQDYADELAACPRCTAAKTTHLASRSEERTTQLAGSGAAPSPSDSAIDYGLPPSAKPATGDAGSAEPLSGISGIAWSALVDEAHTEEGKEIQIDSPSDAEILVHGGTESTPPPGSHEELVGQLGGAAPLASEIADSGVGAEAVDLSSSPPQPTGQLSDSTVDLGAAPVELVEGGSGPVLRETPPGEAEVFVAELASDASHVDLVNDSGIDVSEASAPPRDAAAEVVDSGSNAGPAAAELTEDAALDVIAAADESSAVDLGAPPVESDEDLSVEEAGEDVPMPDGSGIDLEGLPVPGVSPSDLHPSSESSVDLGSHMEITPPVPSEESGVVNAGSGIDVEAPGGSAAGEAISDVALESLLSDSPSGEPIAERELAAAEEPAVSEKEVDDLLAGLDEPPAEGDLAGVSAAEVAEGDEAIAAAEAEEAAETAAEEQAAEAQAETKEKPAKPVKPRSPLLALAGSTLLGVLIGAGGTIGTQAMMGSGDKAKAPAPMSAPIGPSVAAPPSFETRSAHVRNGDWEQADKAGIEQIQDTDPNELATRGSYRLGKYLQKVGSKINPQDPALQPAIQDLQKAAEQKNPDAIYDFALINELAGKLPEARAEYAKGVQAFQNDPVQKQRFESAIYRVDLKTSGKAAGAALIPLPEGVADRAVVLALLLIALQQPPAAQPPQPPGQPPQPPQQQADTKEAGSEFWQAAKLAPRASSPRRFAPSISARKLHDQRRFTRLRKAQNPLSDPAEDIFLRCCDELAVYWRLEERLRGGGYLTDKNTPPEALDALVQKAQTSAAIVKALTDKLIADKIIAKADDVSKGLDRLITAKKDADAKLADLTMKLQKATTENTTLAGKLKTAEKTIESRGTELASAKEQTTKLKIANDGLNATLKKIADELADAKLLDLKGKPDVVAAVKKAIDVAKTKDAQGIIRRQRDEITQLSASLKASRPPEEMLPLWLLLLDENRGRAELASQAAMDVERVKTDPKAPPARKGEAEVVRGLALRNADKFDEAKSVLQAARGAVDKGEWLIRADAALKEVSNPAAYFGRQAQDLYNRGRMDAALAVLARAMKVLPAQEQGKLLARRSLIELDAARAKAKGALPATEPLLIAARRDADEAVKAGLAEGHYAAGRIAEELGQMDVAIKSYRAALAAHQAVDAEGSRYRMALARVLLQPREVRPVPGGQKLGWRDPAPYPARHFEDVRRLVLLLTLGLQAPLLPGEEPGMEEAEKLADEVLKAPPGTVPFNVLAQALAVKGRWNAALQTYVEGIRPLLPREYGNGLTYLILNHPRLKRPDSLRIPNPLEAEKHFAAGLNFYFDRDYANAEKAFLLTIENDGQDARYFYFLGLSRLAQNRRRDAADDFDQGAQLERLNRPAPAAVSESLERIQGPTRQTVNEFRQRQER